MNSIIPLRPQITPALPTGSPVFRSVADVLEAYTGDDSIHVIYPDRIRRAAETFLDGFPGHCLYAVKANPNPDVIRTLWSQGICHFDVASIREIELVQSL